MKRTRYMSGRGLDVGWTAVNPRTGEYFKRPFAYTTASDSVMVEYCAESGMTWYGLSRVPYLSTEMRVVVARFLKDGFGGTPLAEHVMPKLT